MHWEERREEERESVLVRGSPSRGYMSDFCVGVKRCIAS